MYCERGNTSYSIAVNFPPLPALRTVDGAITELYVFVVLSHVDVPFAGTGVGLIRLHRAGRFCRVNIFLVHDIVWESQAALFLHGAVDCLLFCCLLFDFAFSSQSSAVQFE